MSKVEDGSFIIPAGERTLKGVALDSAKKIYRRTVPENLREEFWHKRIRVPRLPFPDAVPVDVDGQVVRFNINDFSDWSRIVWKGYEPFFKSRISEVLKGHTNGNFLDIGAAQGFYALMAAQLGCHSVAIEPYPEMFGRLKKNLKLNPDFEERVQTLNIAVGDKRENVTLHFDKRGTLAPSLKKTNVKFDTTVEVTQIPVDELVESWLIPPPDAVKVDVEGAEVLVIEGMKGLLCSQNAPAHLFIEFHPDFVGKFGGDLREVGNFLLSHGYSVNGSRRRGTEIHCHFAKSIQTDY